MSGYQTHKNFINAAKKTEAALKAKENAAAAKAQQEKVASYMGTPTLTPAGLPGQKKPQTDPTNWWGGKRRTRRNRRRVNPKRKGSRRA